MTPLPRVSVIVPHYRDLGRLDICLRALQGQTYPSDLRDIVIADNASREGPRAVEAVIAGRGRLVSVEEKGAGPARNGGVAVSSGEVLAFTDCDCVPEPGWLAAGVEALSSSDFVGGRMTVFAANPPGLTPAEAFEAVFAFDNETYVKKKAFTVSANLFCPRTLFDAVGGFKVGVSEDLEWCRRAKGLGYRIGYAPHAVVGHPARPTWNDLIKKSRRINAESHALSLTRPAGAFIWLVRGLALPVSAIIHTPKVLFSPKLKGLGQKASVLMMLYRLRTWRFVDSLALSIRDFTDR